MYSVHDFCIHFCPFCSIFIYLPLPRCNFPLSVSKNPPRKKKEKKKKQNKRIVSLFRTGKNFYRFFFLLPSPTLTTSIPFFNSFCHSTKWENWLRLILESNPIILVRDMICSSYWRGERGGAQSLTGMPVLFVQPTLNEICTVYSLSRGKWR